MAIPMSGERVIQAAASSSAKSPILLMEGSYAGHPIYGTSSSFAAGRPRRGGLLRWARHALRGVQLLAELVHQLELRLEVVDVPFFVGEDALEEDRAGGILLLPAHDDAGLEAGHHVVLDREVGLELLAQRLTDLEGEQPLVVRQAVEQQDAVGDRLRVVHLLEGFLARMRGEFGETPVLLHLRMQEVLVDRR